MTYTMHDFSLTDLWKVHNGPTNKLFTYCERHNYSQEKIDAEKKRRGDKFREIMKLRMQGKRTFPSFPVWPRDCDSC